MKNTNKKYKRYPEYKPSGVDWLGKIPEGWGVSRIKFATVINPSKNEVRHLADETLVTFLPMEAIGVCGELDVSLTKKLADVRSGYTYLAENDIIIAKITPCFENGKGAIAGGLENGIAFATTEVISIRSKRSSDYCFFYYLLKSDPFHSMAEGSMYGAGGQKRVSDGFVAEYCFSLPPPAERDAIATFIDKQTAKIDNLIAKAEQAIELMKERRTALISAAVTGKIDVRGQGRGRPRPHLGGVEK